MFCFKNRGLSTKPKSKNISYAKWCIIVIISSMCILIFLGLLTVMIDPFFHFHAPISGLQYPINNERYQNDGIIRHFHYDAIITGTSMTENFKTSEMDKLWGVTSIKIPFSGASYKEINENLKKAIQINPDIKIIVRCLDYKRILDEKDTMRYNLSDYPNYLYDDFVFNDVNYFLNKEILFEDTLGVLKYTKEGGTTTSFDEYANWMGPYRNQAESWITSYIRNEKEDKTVLLSDVDKKNIYENITQNVVELAMANPQIDFYLFFSPYSIYYWDGLNQEGKIEQQLQAEKQTIELLIGQRNIHLFSFFLNYDLICDANEYKDAWHYKEDINSQILLWMYDGEYEITEDNYLDYCNTMEKFYTTYDYENLYE